jgi:hypothetical protein
MFELLCLLMILATVGVFSYKHYKYQEERLSTLKVRTKRFYRSVPTHMLESLARWYDAEYCIQYPPRKIKIRIEAIEEVLEERKLKDNTFK